MLNVRVSGIVVGVLATMLAAGRLPAVREAAAAPAVRTVTPTVAEVSRMDYDCDYDCNSCYFCIFTECQLPGYEVVQDQQGAGWRSAAAYDCVDVSCPQRSNDCPPGGGEEPEGPGLEASTIAATDEQLAAVWDAVDKSDVAVLRQLVRNGRYLELNVSRAAIQVFGCQGIVTSHIPLEPVVLAALTE